MAGALTSLGGKALEGKIQGLIEHTFSSVREKLSA